MDILKALGKSQRRVEFTISNRLLELVKTEAQNEKKTVSQIVKEALVDRYIKEIVADMREDIRQQIKARRAKGR